MNNLLLDESNNDKALIYEISRVLKLYQRDNRYVDMDFLRRVVNICLENDDYDLKHLASIKREGICGVYYDKYDLLCLNLNNIRNEAFYVKKLSLGNVKINASNNSMYYNYSVLMVLLHELTHVKQYFLENNCFNNKIADVIRYSLDIMNNNYDFYNKNHDLFPIERYADLRGMYLSSEIMDYVYKKENKILFKLLYIKRLLSNYNFGFTSPIYDFCQKCDECGITDFYKVIPDMEIRDDNLFERLTLGLSITPYEYQFVVDIFNYITDCYDDGEYFDAEHPVSYIKKYINKSL